MNSDVQKSVDAKTHYFDEYLIVPDSLRPEVDAFCAEVAALGEQCADFNAFKIASRLKGFRKRLWHSSANAPRKNPRKQKNSGGNRSKPPRA